MDRGYDSRVGSGLDVQEIDSGQPLNLTLQQHGLGGLFLSAAQTRTIVRVPLVFLAALHQWRESII